MPPMRSLQIKAGLKQQQQQQQQQKAHTYMEAEQYSTQWWLRQKRNKEWNKRLLRI